MTAPTLAAPTLAAQAVDRLDDGLALPGDRTIAEVFERHCQWSAKPCLICGADGGPECLACAIAAEVEAKRAEDQ